MYQGRIGGEVLVADRGGECHGKLGDIDPHAWRNILYEREAIDDEAARTVIRRPLFPRDTHQFQHAIRAHILRDRHMRVIRIRSVVFELTCVEVLVQSMEFAFALDHADIDYAGGAEEIDLAQSYFNRHGGPALFAKAFNHLAKVGASIDGTRRQNGNVSAGIGVRRQIQTQPIEEFSKRAGDIRDKRKLAQCSPEPYVTKHF
jgi:hypothetical protein